MPKLFECERCGATFGRMLIDTPELCSKCARRQEIETVDEGLLIRPCRAWMPRQDLQMARGEAECVLGSGGLPKASPPSVLPEVPEASGRKLGVANRVLDVLVPEVVL
jgi:hypothetical protein